MGGNSSETGLTSNLVFNQSTAAATLNQMRLFQVMLLEKISLKTEITSTVSQGIFLSVIFRLDWIRYGILHFHPFTTTVTIYCNCNIESDLVLEMMQQLCNNFYFNLFSSNNCSNKLKVIWNAHFEYSNLWLVLSSPVVWKHIGIPWARRSSLDRFLEDGPGLVFQKCRSGSWFTARCYLKAELVLMKFAWMTPGWVFQKSVRVSDSKSPPGKLKFWKNIWSFPGFANKSFNKSSKFLNWTNELQFTPNWP